MRSLSRYKISVRALAYVVLGIFLSWYGLFLAMYYRMISEKGTVSLCLPILNILPVVNLVLMLILWGSYRKAGKVHAGLVRWALFAALFPGLVILCVNFDD